MLLTASFCCSRENERDRAAADIAARPARRKPAAAGRRARRRAARSIRRRCEEVQALLTDRPRRRDLLIEHLHLIQDHYGHLSARASGGAGAGDEACAHRSLRGRDLLRPFRRGEGRRDAAAAGHRAGLQFAVLRARRRRAICLPNCRSKLGTDVRVVRAPCMGACDRAPVCAVGHVQVMQADAAKVAAAAAKPAHAHAYPTPSRLRRLCEERRL